MLLLKKLYFFIKKTIFFLNNKRFVSKIIKLGIIMPFLWRNNLWKVSDNCLPRTLPR